MSLPGVILDAGPLGLLGKASGRPVAALCLTWIEGLLSEGRVVAVPEIVRYEVRRELFRLGAAASLSRLDRLHPRLLLLRISGDVMDIASELWAGVRRAGLPTAPDDTLDGDAIFAAQALVAAEEWGGAIVATTNVTHLSLFPGIDAREWWEVG